MKKTFLLFLFLISNMNASFALEGLAKGTKAPQMSLMDTSGKTFNLHEQKKKTVLVFFRGSWCPYCVKQLQSLEKEVSKINELGAQLVAISVDRKLVAKKMHDKQGFSFTVLSDSKASSLKSFNIVNKLDPNLVKKYKSAYQIDVEADSGETHHMIAHPAVFIVDENNKIIFSDVHTNYKERTANSDILKALR